MKTKTHALIGALVISMSAAAQGHHLITYEVAKLQGVTNVTLGPNTFISYDANNKPVPASVFNTVLSGVKSCKSGLLVIHINSPGGSVELGNQLMAAMDASPCTVETDNDGTAASMAAEIFFHAKFHKVADNSIFLMHTGSISFGVGPISTDVACSRSNIDNPFNMMIAVDLKECYDEAIAMGIPAFGKYLTVEEKQHYLFGDDVWIKGTDMAKRLGITTYHNPTPLTFPQ